MKPVLLCVAILLLSGCSGSTGSAEWEIHTGFALTENESGGTFQTYSGLYFKVALSEESGTAWELLSYDSSCLEVVDSYVEETEAACRSVWVFHAAQAGETWLEFSLRGALEGEPGGTARYWLVVR